jgi:hypothetical protein
VVDMLHPPSSLALAPKDRAEWLNASLAQKWFSPPDTPHLRFGKSLHIFAGWHPCMAGEKLVHPLWTSPCRYI